MLWDVTLLGPPRVAILHWSTVRYSLAWSLIIVACSFQFSRVGSLSTFRPNWLSVYAAIQQDIKLAADRSRVQRATNIWASNPSKILNASFFLPGSIFLAVISYIESVKRRLRFVPLPDTWARCSVPLGHDVNFHKTNIIDSFFFENLCATC